MTDDEKVAQRYRALGAEEPPRTLDDAILAAARRSARPWTQRWAVPLSLAAVLVLSVTVTLRIQQEQPGVESPVPQAKKQEAPAPAVPAPTPPAPVAQARPKPKVEQARKSAARKEPEPFPSVTQDKVAAEQAPAAAAAAAPAPASSGMLASRRDAAPADAPARELERIAGLRRLGMHEEADKALAEFRKRYPDYAIPEAMRARVERR